jgi:hypothetical protein
MDDIIPEHTHTGTPVAGRRVGAVPEESIERT